MRNLAFVATLFSLLPSFIGVAVETNLLGPSFCRVSKEIPLIWSDGKVSVEDDKVVISVGDKSTLTVYSHGESARIHKFISYVKETVELSEPNVHVVITTKTDQVHSGEVIDRHSSVNDVATLKIIKREPMIGTIDPEKSIKTKYAFYRRELLQVFDLDFDLVFEKDRAPVEDRSVEYFDEFIPHPSNDIEANEVVKETEETRDHETRSNDFFDKEVQNYPGNNLKGQQFKFGICEEPMIYISTGLVKEPYFVNSFTGKILRTKRKNRKPFAGKYRIPDDTKMLIVNEGDLKKYYKNIIKGSKVWYLRRDEKVLYPCIVRFFSIDKNPQPTLECIGLEPRRVPNVQWYDIFPIEADDLIEDLGQYKIHRKDIKWSDLRQKQSR